MKSVIVRCEDEAWKTDRTASLLEGARLLHLQQLAQTGAAGLLQSAESSRQGFLGFERLRLHRELLGIEADDPNGIPGRWYALGAGVAWAPEETVWCCDLVTQRDGLIIDHTAGRISTKESDVLIHALDEALSNESRRWEVGGDARHLFITNDSNLRPGPSSSVPATERLAGQSWRRALPKSQTGETLQGLMDEAARVLEQHPINRVRIDLGENPANFLWLWGPAQGSLQVASRRLEAAGAVVSSSFVLRGMAHALGWTWQKGPASLQERAVTQLEKAIERLLERHEIVYVHASVESADPVERQCVMERLDQLVLKPVTQRLSRLKHWQMLVLVDDRPSGTIPFIAAGANVPQQPVTTLSSSQFAESPLRFGDGAALRTWWMQSAEKIIATR